MFSQKKDKSWKKALKNLLPETSPGGFSWAGGKGITGHPPEPRCSFITAKLLNLQTRAPFHLYLGFLSPLILDKNK